MIGAQLVNRLTVLGHELIVASPKNGVNSITGEGLSEAMTGADVVVDVSNSPSYADIDVMNFFTTSTRNIIGAETESGVKHHVLLSILGVDRPNVNGYFRAKLAQEDLVMASGIPYSILRSPQFFEFVGGIVLGNSTGQDVKVSPAFIQPASSANVVAALAEISISQPLNALREVAGPEKFRLDDLAKKYLVLKNDSRPVITDAAAPYFGAILTETSLLPGASAQLLETRYEDWIAQPGNLQ